MAQSGYTPILIYASSTPGALPSAANLTSSASGAELAINYADGKLYFKNSSGVVTLLAGSSSGPAGGSNTQVQYNSSGVLAGSSNMTFNGTKLTVAGFLDSALTSGRVPYATTSGELTDSANLLYSGADLTVYGLTVGRGAGAQPTNTAVGASALATPTSGTDVAAFGKSSLAANTSGAQNSAFGSLSLTANLTGSDNSAIGYGALLLNTTGSQNTAVGREALRANTTASNNTAVGYQAGYSNTTGVGLTALGSLAAYSNTTGISNTAIGSERSGVTAAALRNVTTGSYHVAVGTGALASVVSNSSSTAVGFAAGYNATGGANTFIGVESGGSVSTGTYNTFVGAGSYGTGTAAGHYVTTGSKNTILGAYNGNQDGLDIRTASNYAVISDGDGNRLLSTANSYSLALDGGAVPQSGTGITFPATQSASSDANTLDDYEEGTWTPSIGGNATYGIDTGGRYVKVGKVVTVWGKIQITTKGTGSATTISGLPFTSANLGLESSGSTTYYANLAVNVITPQAVVPAAATTVQFYSATSAGTGSGGTLSIFGDSSRIYFTVTYETST